MSFKVTDGKESFYIFNVVFKCDIDWKGKINITPLKSLWCDQIYEPIKISMSRMRVTIMMFYRMNIIHNLLI